MGGAFHLVWIWLPKQGLRDQNVFHVFGLPVEVYRLKKPNDRLNEITEEVERGVSHVRRNDELNVVLACLCFLYILEATHSTQPTLKTPILNQSNLFNWTSPSLHSFPKGSKGFKQQESTIESVSMVAWNHAVSPAMENQNWGSHVGNDANVVESLFYEEADCPNQVPDGRLQRSECGNQNQRGKFVLRRNVASWPTANGPSNDDHTGLAEAQHTLEEIHDRLNVRKH